MNNRAVAYMRYSSHLQSSTSIESQRLAIETYCKNNNFVLVDEYVDEAKSATTDNRPAFQRMIKDSESKPEWGSVIVYDLSRFSRNVENALKYYNLLRDNNISLIAVTMPLEDDSPESDLTREFQFMYSAYFSKHLAKRTHDGLTCRAQKGIHCGGKPPLGYNVDEEGKLVINDVEAKVVREIFSMYLEGMSYADMAEYLNNKQVLTKAGEKFTKNSFYHILTQEKYIGTYRWNKRKAKNSKRRRNNHAYKPLEEQTVIEDGCPAIIPKDVFDKAQNRLAERSQGRATSKGKTHYALGGMGIMHCSICGAEMVGKVTTSHGRKYTSYACPNHRDKGCPTKDITAKNMEKYVTSVIALSIVKSTNLSALNEVINSYIQNDESGNLSVQLSRLEKQIRNLADCLAENPSKVLIAKLKDCEEKKEILERQMMKIRTQTPKITNDDIKPLKVRLAKHLRTSKEPAVRTLLKSCVEDILVDNDGVTVSLNL